MFLLHKRFHYQKPKPITLFEKSWIVNFKPYKVNTNDNVQRWITLYIFKYRTKTTINSQERLNFGEVYSTTFQRGVKGYFLLSYFFGTWKTKCSEKSSFQGVWILLDVLPTVIFETTAESVCRIWSKSVSISVADTYSFYT